MFIQETHDVFTLVALPCPFAFISSDFYKKKYITYIFILIHLVACYVSMFVIFSYICSIMFELYNHKSFYIFFPLSERKELKEKHDKEKRFFLTFLAEYVKLRKNSRCAIILIVICRWD